MSGDKWAAATSYVRQLVDQLVGDALQGHFAGHFTVVLMLCVGMCLLRTAARRPRLSGGLLLTWCSWFGWAVFTDRTSLEDMGWRGRKVYTATQAFWVALLELVVAWALFVAPFLGDLFELGRELWGLVSLERKVQAGVLCLFGYVLLQIYFSALRKLAQGRRMVGRAASDGKRRMLEQRDVVLHMLWQASFALVGGALWWGTEQLPAHHIPAAVWVLLSVWPGERQQHRAPGL
jgi:hypothetical protein